MTSFMCPHCGRDVPWHRVSLGGILQCSDCGFFVEPPDLPPPDAGELLVVAGPDAGKVAPVSDGLVMGRSKDAGFQLSAPDISRKHARLTISGGELVVEDLGSLNGIAVGGKRTARSPLTDGCELMVGRATLIRCHLARQSAEAGAGGAAYQLERSAAILGGTCVIDPEQLEASSDRGIPNLDELLRIQSKMKRVYRASEKLSNLFDSEQLLQQLLGIVTELVPAERGCVLLLDRSRQRIEVKAITNRLEKDARSLGLSSTIIRRVFNERVGILTEDAQADPSLMSRRSVMIEGIRSVLCAPMILRQQVYGAIYLDSTTQLQAFHPEDLEAVLALGRQAAIGLENSRLVETIRQETITRANLQRFLPGHLVEQVFTQQISMRPGGTMGQVTVLFTDLRDFTRQSAGLKPDEVLLMLNAYFEEMIEVLFSHDGTLDKFIGDALMATWGATVSCADGALRAVRCALAMLERLEAFNKAHATSGWPPLKMGIGINTGPVIIGNLGSAKRMEYTVLGHTVNLASRLESLNKELNTQLLIGEETYKQVQACVQAFPHRARVKGLDQPITLYAVEGMLETPTAS